MTAMIKAFSFLIVSVFLASLLLTGCSTYQPPGQKGTLAPAGTMYVKKATGSFQRGDAVTVSHVEGVTAYTDRGTIPYAYLEKERSSFTLTVTVPQGAVIKILNIKPKYSDGMWLQRGPYHIQVTKPGYHTYDRWIKIDADQSLAVTLQKKLLSANGTLLWKKEAEFISTPGSIWYQQPEHAEKMTWESAANYCAVLESRLYGYRMERFTLPSDTELLGLSEATRPFVFTDPLYWSATTDAKQTAYAKYVNINSGESSWYKKHGKTYAMCRQAVTLPAKVTLQQLALALMDTDTAGTFNFTAEALSSDTQETDEASLNRRSLNAFRMAMFLLYGRPLVQNVQYDKEKGVLHYTVVSQNRNAEGAPYYANDITLSVGAGDAAAISSQLQQPNFDPIIEFDVQENRLRYIDMSVVTGSAGTP